MSKKSLTRDMLIEIMRDEYKTRLMEVMQETDMFDNQGNMVIRKGLKVRHKDTQYEYTVDDVTKTPEGDIVVNLKLPEEPRFTGEPSGDEDVITGSAKKEVIQEVDPPSIPSKEESPAVTPEVPGEDETEEGIFVIDQEEFEKEYEVK